MQYLIVLAFIVALLCVAFPFVVNLINGNALFNRDIMAGDITGAGLIIFGSAVCGAFLGNFFHPRVVRNRKSAYAFLALTCVVAVTEVPLVREFPFLKYILWVMPRITYPSEILVLILYAVVYGGVKSFICAKNKF